MKPFDQRMPGKMLPDRLHQNTRAHAMYNGDLAHTCQRRVIEKRLYKPDGIVDALPDYIDFRLCAIVSHR
jgi:hypothetical protein